MGLSNCRAVLFNVWALTALKPRLQWCLWQWFIRSLHQQNHKKYKKLDEFSKCFWVLWIIVFKMFCSKTNKNPILRVKFKSGFIKEPDMNKTYPFKDLVKSKGWSTAKLSNERFENEYELRWRCLPLLLSKRNVLRDWCFLQKVLCVFITVSELENYSLRLL